MFRMFVIVITKIKTELNLDKGNIRRVFAGID